LHAAQSIVGLLEPIDRDAHALQPRLLGRLATLGVQTAPAGRHERHHAVAANAPDDVDPVLAQVGFATDQAHFADPELRHLVDEVEALLGRELIRAIAPRPRSAVAT